jgi:chemotaxis response regulator CheB
VDRRLLREALTAEPTVEMVGIAPYDESAIKGIEETKPDAVTLDVQCRGSKKKRPKHLGRGKS